MTTPKTLLDEYMASAPVLRGYLEVLSPVLRCDEYHVIRADRDEATGVFHNWRVEWDPKAPLDCDDGLEG